MSATVPYRSAPLWVWFGTLHLLQNHRIIKVGKDLQDRQVQLSSYITFHSCLQAFLNQVFLVVKC